MADGVDAAVDPVEPTGRRPVLDGLLPQPHRDELGVRHNSVLLRSELSYLTVAWST